MNKYLFDQKGLIVPAILIIVTIAGFVGYYIFKTVFAQTADTMQPVLAIISPEDGNLVPRNGAVMLIATYFDESQLLIDQKHYVEFYYSDGRLACRSTYLECYWGVPAKPNVTYSIFVQAYDQVGNLGKSPAINLTAVDSSQISPTPTPTSNPNLDTTPPTLTIVSPPDNSMVPRGGAVTLTATYFDETPLLVDKDHYVEFYYLNGNLACRSTYLECYWGIPSKPNVTYLLYVQAYDKAGNLGKSASIKVTSSN